MKNRDFFDALHYLKMKELKNLCVKNQLSTKGMKGEIIRRLHHYLVNGRIVNDKAIPPESKANPSKKYLLKPSTLILQGSYKNDLKTRTFFKKLIGKHFHFTAFGQDWIRDRWHAGKPPTYQAFAKFWQEEYLKRKNKKAKPKQEWAYLTFIQNYLKKSPHASKKEITNAWNKTRLKKIKLINKMLSQKL